EASDEIDFISQSLGRYVNRGVGIAKGRDQKLTLNHRYASYTEYYAPSLFFGLARARMGLRPAVDPI
ncbi:MAG: hypothetical protein AB8H79_05150, partial [Myxococcota bacterium]